MNKSMLRSGMISILLLLWIAPNHFSQQKSLTIDQAIEIGLENSKTLRISSEKVIAARAKVKEVDAMQYPWLKLTAGYTRLSEVDPFSIVTPFQTFTISPSILNTYMTRVTLSQPLFTGFRISSSLDAAQYSSDATSSDYRKDKQELVLNIKSAYWNLYKASELKKVLDETVTQVKAHVQDAKNLLTQGLMTQNDVLKIEVQLSDVLYKQADMKNAVRLSTIALNNVLGISLSTEIELSDKALLKETNSIDLDKLLGEAIQKRPEIDATNYRIKAGKSSLDIAKSGWYPQVAFVGNYTYSRPNQRIVPSKDRFDGTWDVGVSLSYDLWNWFSTSHQSEQAEAQLSQANDSKGLLLDGITMDVTQNYLSVQLAKEKITISDLAQKQAEENFRITGEKFKQGIALSSDLIDAEVAFVSAKTNYTNALVDYELALARLEKAVGKENL